MGSDFLCNNNKFFFGKLFTEDKTYKIYKNSSKPIDKVGIVLYNHHIKPIGRIGKRGGGNHERYIYKAAPQEFPLRTNAYGGTAGLRKC